MSLTASAGSAISATSTYTLVCIFSEFDSAEEGKVDSRVRSCLRRFSIRVNFFAQCAHASSPSDRDADALSIMISDLGTCCVGNQDGVEERGRSGVDAPSKRISWMRAHHGHGIMWTVGKTA